MPSLELVPDDSLKLENVLKKLVGVLLSQLRQETGVYEELRKIVFQERGILNRPSLDLLHTGNARKDVCLAKARLLEDARMKIVEKIASFFNERQEVINISFLLPHLGERQREELLVLQKNLFAIVADVKRANDANGDVLDYSLARVKHSLNFINDLKGMKSGYSRSGGKGKITGNGMLFSQEV